MELSTSDLIQLIGIMVAIITGITSIAISIITLRQNSKMVKESNKAQIEIFPYKVCGDIYILKSGFKTLVKQQEL